jgi:hypothetical protein
MWVVAVRKLDGPEPHRVAAIASALGLTPYEARARAQGPAPRVVGTFGQQAPAEVAAALLEAAGLQPIVFGDEQVESDRRRLSARTFVLGPSAARFVLRDGRSFDVAGTGITLLLRGTRIYRDERTEVTTQRKLSVGKAVLTGGLLLTSEKKKETTISTEVREGFLIVYAPGSPDVILGESSVLYDGLGPAMGPTRAANFLRLVTEMRNRASTAVYDERLLTRAGQAQVLGGVLGPEPFLDVAITVLSTALRTVETPYR